MDGRIRHIQFLAENGMDHQLKTILEMGKPGLWGDLSLESFDSCFRQIHETLEEKPSLTACLELAVITEFLICPSRMPHWGKTWVRENLQLPGFPLEKNRGDLLKGTWKSIQVPLVGSNGGTTFFCRFSGTILPGDCSVSILPEWAERIMAPETINAVKTAGESVQAMATGSNLSFFVYPLVSPDAGIRITGTSLGLPLAILFSSLLGNHDFNPSMTATGKITVDGGVHRVAGIPEKTAAAESHRFRLFLMPPQRTGCNDPGIEIRQVSRIRDALFFARFHGRGKDREMDTIAEMMKSGRIFAANLGHADFSLLKSAVESKLMEHSLRELEQDGDAFQFFSSFLEKRNFLNRPIEEREFITSLVDLDRTISSRVLPPSGLLKLASFFLHTANNRGRIKRADRIVKAGKRCIRNAASIPVETLTDFHNNRLVALHNRYQFRDDPDSEALAENLEKRHEIGIHMGSLLDPLFGRFCGTMAQQSGFMGPEFLDNFKKWNLKARQCFGEKLNQSEQFSQEWLRQYNYAVYAFLDAGMISQAGEALLAYLGKNSINAVLENIEFPDTMDNIPPLPWQHSVVCRFFADAENVDWGSRYLKAVLPDTNRISTVAHPWQLWYCNAGKIANFAGNPDQAAELFKKSLAICLNKKMGATVRVMGLIPLHGLFLTQRLDILNKKDLIWNMIKEAGEELDPAHFSILNNCSDIRELFRKKDFSIRTLFPFSFR